ncbi:H-NS histone family protein [Rhodobacter sp. NSM]|uniref:H-NS histone family protein n=1 Tax=Rhodobacter sp. NSM TaxID=3457501 RepID=UPI003FD2EB49
MPGEGAPRESDRAALDIDLEALSREELVELQIEVAAALAALERQRRKDALAELAGRARELGFTLEELAGSGRAHPRAPLGPRYANPANPDEIWYGRGRKPHWFKKAMATGRTPEDLLL